MNTINTTTMDSITRIVWQATLPRGCSKTVLACLAWHAVLNERDQCWPHIDTLARLCGFQRRTVIGHLAVLAKAGLIASTPRPGTSNLYQLNRVALIALSSEQPAVDISNKGAENAARGAENARETAFSSPIREKEGIEKEEGRERNASARAPGDAAPAEAAFPPLPDLENLKTGIPAAPVISPDTLAAVNAQRQGNGKQPFSRADLIDLGREATLAGIAPQAAAEWILARPGRNFFRASFAVQTPAATAPAAPAPLCEATKAQARARADQVQADLLRRSIEAMRAPVLVGQPAPHIERRSAPRAVITRHPAPVSVGGTTGTGWARDAVARFVAGQAVSRAAIGDAAKVLGLPLADLKAQRAALATVAA